MSASAFVAVTDTEWFEFLRVRAPLDEVNFWQPGGGRNFRALELGEPLLFKLKYPVNAIAGGGFFAHFSRMPVSLAWEAFGEKNGAASFPAMRENTARLRRADQGTTEDFEIGCIILAEPFFLPQNQWIPAPADFQANTVVGKGYDLTSPAGQALWERVLAARALTGHQLSDQHQDRMYGPVSLHRPRMGQGGFRIAVTDAYARHCAVTREKTLPVLEAAHILPVAAGGRHEVANGLLLRSDIHTLFDRGYVTVTRDHRFRVSPRLRADWSNGKAYYALDGASLELPADPTLRPSREALEWHEDTTYLG